MQKLREQVTLQTNDAPSRLGGTGLAAAVSGRGMRIKLLAALGIALVCAGTAVYLSNAWLDSQFNRTQVVQAPAPAPEKPKVKIVVATKPLKYGVALTPGVLTEIEWPGDAVPAGAFRSTSEVITSEGARVVLTPIALNEPILASKVTDPGQAASLSAMLRDGYSAVTIRVDDVLGVAGLITPGDRVDVLWTRVQGQSTAADQTYTEVLLRRARVLALDQTVQSAASSTDLPSGYAKAVTVEVSTVQAQKVALAAATGKMFLSLQPVADLRGPSVRRVTTSDLSVRYRSEEAAEDLATETMQASTAAPGFEMTSRKASSVPPKEEPAKPAPALSKRLVIGEDYAIVGVTRGIERREYNVRQAVEPK